ncbi:response regulator transcription factor [Brevibacillus reuszeri]|uniref:LuxR family transcriptional regulator n=3 Tax=Brevibacillus reuszeri TaxID=54915 RepID=A0A0K9Z1D8_9BACL|nr:response regulator transcription factor [Brevibacillus reuszeri]KNB74769.1 LuxR family transcriptional regulator [Brevibacillus reuszeri]MED1859589.1 response regulator transcription factor [Brevibacillus reuszeri]
MTVHLIRVIIVDDQHLVRHGLRFMINAQEDMEVVGEAAGGHEAVQLAKRVLPDVVLMDVQMPEGGGIEATRSIIASNPECKVIILTTFDQEEYVYDGIRSGAVGYLLKGAAPEELVDTVRAAWKGEAIFRTTVAAKVIGQIFHSSQALQQETDLTTAAQRIESLTERELEVLQQMAYGLRNEEIAKKLYIGESTVKTHVHRIIQKFDVEDRTQAVVIAIRNRIVH